MPKKPIRFETWMQSKWRPMMGWMYMIVCIFDFILFPMGHALLQYWDKTAATQQITQWVPLTMSGAGLFHMAMGAVLGIYVWSRGQEKMKGVNGMSMPQYSTMNYQPQSMVENSYDYESTVDTVSTVKSDNKGRKSPVQPSDPVL